MKLNGPNGELLPAAWNWSEVLAGVEPFHDSVDQIDVRPASGLLSFVLETRLPLAGE
jgi:hypothetical protein